VAAAIAVPVIVFGLGRYHWFLRDDWDLLAGRSLTDPVSMMRPYAEHWVVLPAVLYRVNWQLFGINTYVPYQVLPVLAHVGAATMLRLLMRRHGVRPWIATAAAGTFLLFGAGSQNLVWAFQAGMTGSIFFGLAQVVVADHDGPIGRRDGAAVLLGILAMFGSAVGAVLVGVTAVAILARRGWRAALLQAAPPLTIFGIWYAWSAPYRANAMGRPSMSVIADWIGQGISGTFEAVGQQPWIAVTLGLVLVIGLPLAWWPLRGRELLRAAAIPMLLLGAMVGFNLITAASRGVFGAEFARQSRYLHTNAAFLLVPLAVAADAVARAIDRAVPRAATNPLAAVRVGTILIVGLFLLPIPANIAAFDKTGQVFGPGYFDQQRALVVALARSPLVDQVSKDLVPIHDPYGGDKITAGWLAAGARDGLIPTGSPPSAALTAEVTVRLGVRQSIGDPLTTNCRTVERSIDLKPTKGQRYSIRTSVTIGALTEGKPVGSPVPFDVQNGYNLRVEVDGLHLRIASVAAAPGLPAAASFSLCAA